MFATSSIVVAPHGAGLSNTIVSPLHTPILEIAPLACPLCYMNLSLKVLTVPLDILKVFDDDIRLSIAGNDNFVAYKFHLVLALQYDDWRRESNFRCFSLCSTTKQIRFSSNALLLTSETFWRGLL